MQFHIIRAQRQKDEQELKALREEEAEINKQINQVGKVFQGAAVGDFMLVRLKTLIRFLIR